MKIQIFGFIITILLFSCIQQNDAFVYQMKLDLGWKMQNSVKINTKGSDFLTAKFDSSLWINAIVPGTVLNGLVQADVYQDIYRDKNIENIPVVQFDTSWIYRKEFELEKIMPVSILCFDGINYRANIWLNGKKIFDKETLVNPFRQFETNISDKLKKGKNVMFVEVFPPKSGDFTIGFVDWNPAPPDRNMGITRDVKILFNNGVRLSKTYVETKLDENYKDADLFISTELDNYSGDDIAGQLKIIGEDFMISKIINLKKNEKKRIKLNPSEFAVLHLKNPVLWWPHTIGQPKLHKIEATFTFQSQISDKQEVEFGIRKFESFYTPEGHRGIMVNGKKISIRGGGWVDDLTLNDSPEYIRNQLEYVKDMNLNTIRLEGFWGKGHELYRLCDEMGILVMVGWSCQWEWEDYLGKACDESYGGILSKADIKMMSMAWKDQIVWLRNHASIFAWLGGSDCIPKPELEKEYFKIFAEYDSTRVYLPSAKDWTSLAGPSGVKMRGPYDYEPPVYWYSDTLFGGAFGFNTETGPGAQVPPLESIKKMISPGKLWPINDVWEYHCGRHAFGNLDRFRKALNLRYGAPKSVEEFAFKAQLLNYELMRPMFEAFSANRYKATGVIQWMLNSAWPEMYWQLYDTYLMPNGAYFGAKKGSQPIQAIYNYQNNSIYLINDKLGNTKLLTIDIKVFDIQSKLIHSKTITQIAKANESNKIYEIPDIKELTKTYFLSLKILSHNVQVADNFYWLSTKKDMLDYKAEVPGWNFHTPSKEYADFTLLNTMEKGTVTHILKVKDEGDYQIFKIDLINPTDKIAFFIEAKIIDKNDGLSILPVLWTDNYVSVLPGNSKSITAKIRKEYLKGKIPELVINGF
jgi:exo-1,4-beta-D-glucosaminidase